MPPEPLMTPLNSTEPPTAALQRDVLIQRDRAGEGQVRIVVAAQGGHAGVARQDVDWPGDGAAVGGQKGRRFGVGAALAGARVADLERGVCRRRIAEGPGPAGRDIRPGDERAVDHARGAAVAVVRIAQQNGLSAAGAVGAYRGKAPRARDQPTERDGHGARVVGVNRGRGGQVDGSREAQVAAVCALDADAAVEDHGIRQDDIGPGGRRAGEDIDPAVSHIQRPAPQHRIVAEVGRGAVRIDVEGTAETRVAASEDEDPGRIIAAALLVKDPVAGKAAGKRQRASRIATSMFPVLPPEIVPGPLSSMLCAPLIYMPWLLVHV